MMKTQNLSEQARQALMSGANHHQGTVLAGLSVRVAAELVGLGLIGAGHGLTRRGSIVAEQVREEALSDAFGF